MRFSASKHNRHSREVKYEIKFPLSKETTVLSPKSAADSRKYQALV